MAADLFELLKEPSKYEVAFVIEVGLSKRKYLKHFTIYIAKQLSDRSAK